MKGVIKASAKKRNLELCLLVAIVFEPYSALFFSACSLDKPLLLACSRAKVSDLLSLAIALTSARSLLPAVPFGFLSISPTPFPHKTKSNKLKKGAPMLTAWRPFSTGIIVLIVQF